MANLKRGQERRRGMPLMGGEVPLIVGRGMSPDIPPSRAAPRGWVVVCRVGAVGGVYSHAP